MLPTVLLTVWTWKARVGKQEFAVTVLKPGSASSEQEARELLQHEFTLLIQGSALKSAFDSYASTCVDVNIPSESYLLLRVYGRH